MTEQFDADLLMDQVRVSVNVSARMTARMMCI